MALVRSAHLWIVDNDRLSSSGSSSLTWRDNIDQWVVRAFVDNVMDETHTRGFTTSTSSGDYSLRAENLYPRYYGVDVTYRFGAL